MAGGFNWSSLMSSGGGGGGGGGGGMDMSSMMNMGGRINSDVMAAIEEPFEIRRRRRLEIAPEYADVGTSIQPVSRYAGGSRMAAAAASEMGKATDASLRDRYSSLDLKMRNLNAEHNVARRGAGIVRRIAELVAGGYAGGGMGGGGGGGGAAGAVPEAGMGLGQGAGAPAAGGGFSWGGLGQEYLSGGQGDDRPALSSYRFSAPGAR